MLERELDLELDLDDDALGLVTNQRMLHSPSGEPLEGEIELWVHQYFHSIMEILNGFFTYISPVEAVERFEAISFADLVKEQLEGEPAAVIDLAISHINELKEVEIGFMRAYCD